MATQTVALDPAPLQEQEMQDFIERFHTKQQRAKQLATALRVLYVLISGAIAIVGILGTSGVGSALDAAKLSGTLGVILTLILGIDNQLAVTEKAENYRLVWAQSQSFLSRFRRAKDAPSREQEYDKFISFRETSDGASINPELGKKK